MTISAPATIAAVSDRSTWGPSVQVVAPAATAPASSSAVQPPSGPTITAVTSRPSGPPPGSAVVARFKQLWRPAGSCQLLT